MTKPCRIRPSDDDLLDMEADVERNVMDPPKPECGRVRLDRPKSGVHGGALFDDCSFHYVGIKT